MTKKVRVLIAGVGGGGYGVEIMKTLRLRDSKYFIYGVDMSALSLGLFLADKSSVVPPAASSGYLKKLLAVCKKEKIQVVIPGSDPDLKAISFHQATIEKQGIFVPINTPAVIDMGLNKLKTMEILQSHQCLIPRTVIVKTAKDISKAKFFPAIVKPYIGGGGSNFTFLAQDPKELDFFVRYCLKYGIAPMIQQYLGTADDEYTIGVLSDREGEIISTVGLRRFIKGGLSNRLRVASRFKKGETLVVSSGLSQGEITRDPRILGEARRIAKAIGSRGPVNIQGRFHQGKFYTFEINPRFSGTTYFRALAGINEPDLLIRKYVLGESVSRDIRPASGKILRGLFEKFIPDV